MKNNIVFKFDDFSLAGFKLGDLVDGDLLGVKGVRISLESGRVFCIAIYVSEKNYNEPVYEGRFFKDGAEVLIDRSTTQKFIEECFGLSDDSFDDGFERNYIYNLNGTGVEFSWLVDDAQCELIYICCTLLE